MLGVLFNRKKETIKTFLFAEVVYYDQTKKSFDSFVTRLVRDRSTIFNDIDNEVANELSLRGTDKRSVSKVYVYSIEGKFVPDRSSYYGGD